MPLSHVALLGYPTGAADGTSQSLFKNGSVGKKGREKKRRRGGGTFMQKPLRGGFARCLRRCGGYRFDDIHRL